LDHTNKFFDQTIMNKTSYSSTSYTFLDGLASSLLSCRKKRPVKDPEERAMKEFEGAQGRGGTMSESTNHQSKDATQDSNSTTEKRKQPRFYLNLPIEFRVMNAQHVLGAMIVNASETGLLVQSPNNVPAGTKLNIVVLFSKGFELANLEVLAEVVWTKTQSHEGRQGYELGLKFIQISEEDRQKLKHLFGDGP